MGLKSMSLLAAATIAPTGGTALNFVDDGVGISNGVHLVCSTDTNYATRRQVTCKVRPFALDPKTGKYTKDKKSMTLVVPRPQTDNSVVFETLRVERELLPSTTAAEALEMNKLAVQMLIDSDCTGFWDNGSLA